MFASVFGLFFCGIYIFAALVSLALTGLWIYALIDVIRRESWETDNEQLMWVVIILVTGFVGAIIYYVMVMRKRG